MPYFICSKILGEAAKQESLQQILRKFWISNRLPNRYFPENPKIDVGCPCLNYVNSSRASNSLPVGLKQSTTVSFAQYREPVPLMLRKPEQERYR